MKNFNLSLMVGLLILACSCATFEPQMQGIPLIHEKGDLRIDAGGTFNKLSLNGTAAYGITDKFAVQIGGRTSLISQERNDYGQIAIGYYKNFKEHLLFETYAGAGYGHAYGWDFVYPSSYNMSGYYQNYFLSGNIGYVNEIFQIGFGIKSGFMNSSLVDQGFYGAGYDNWPDGTRFRDQLLSLEPGIVARFGFKHFKFHIRGAGLLMHNLTNSQRKPPFFPLNIGAGVSLDF